MIKEGVLVVGLGEVGRALFELLRESGKFDVYGFDIDEVKLRSIVGNVKLPDSFDVMHVCYPCSDRGSFVKVTVNYIRRFKPKLTIINSTVAPGTTQKVYEETKSLVGIRQYVACINLWKL